MSASISRPPGFKTRCASCKRLLLIEGQVEDAVADDRVEAAVREGEGLGLAHLKGDVGKTQPRLVGPGALDHGGGDVQAHHPAAGPHQMGRHQGVHPGAAADVQDRVPGVKGPQAEGIAHAAEGGQDLRGKIPDDLRGIALQFHAGLAGGVLEAAAGAGRGHPVVLLLDALPHLENFRFGHFRAHGIIPYCGFGGTGFPAVGRQARLRRPLWCVKRTHFLSGNPRGYMRSRPTAKAWPKNFPMP